MLKGSTNIGGIQKRARFWVVILSSLNLLLVPCTRAAEETSESWIKPLVFGVGELYGVQSGGRYYFSPEGNFTPRLNFSSRIFLEPRFTLGSYQLVSSLGGGTSLLLDYEALLGYRISRVFFLEAGGGEQNLGNFIGTNPAISVLLRLNLKHRIFKVLDSFYVVYTDNLIPSDSLQEFHAGISVGF